MRGAVQRFARRLWRGEAGVPGALLGLVLAPVSLVWWLTVVVRNRRYDRAPPGRVDGVQVVSVGNLAVGGTGKTPVASWVATALDAQGRRPAILHGGYGLDEPRLHERWTPGVPVIVGRDRIAGAGRAARAGADVVVLDDGFQHRRIARDLDLVVLSVEDPFPGPVLPRGPYREPASSLARADGIVLTRRSATLDDAHDLARRVATLVPQVPVLGCVRFEAAGLRPLLPASKDGPQPNGEVHVPVGQDTPALDRALVLTAVGRPDAVRASVADLAEGDVRLEAYADHHDFTAADVRAARSRAGEDPIVVTEKDAVKLEDHAALLGACYVLQQSLAWDWGEDAVRARLDLEGTS